MKIKIDNVGKRLYYNSPEAILLPQVWVDTGLKDLSLWELRLYIYLASFKDGSIVDFNCAKVLKFFGMNVGHTHIQESIEKFQEKGYLAEIGEDEYVFRMVPWAYA